MEKKEDLEELMKEVQEARRIKMLHQASKAMDMEHELRALRIQLAEKSKHSLLLQKERTNDRTRLVIATNSGIVFRVFIGVSFPSVSLNKIHLLSSLRSTFDVSISNDQDLKVHVCLLSIPYVVAVASPQIQGN
ncbi:hypothetical protein V6N13_109562 [Hibiscus sabdariffa]